MNRVILVVDDDDDLRETVATPLAEQGYRVRRAVDAAAALGELSTDPPALVLADVVLPTLAGLSLARFPPADGRAVPVVLLGERDEGGDLPGVRFLPKPVARADLLQIVAESLGTGDPPPTPNNQSLGEPNERPRA